MAPAPSGVDPGPHIHVTSSTDYCTVLRDSSTPTRMNTPPACHNTPRSRTAAPTAAQPKCGVRHVRWHGKSKKDVYAPVTSVWLRLDPLPRVRTTAASANRNACELRRSRGRSAPPRGLGAAPSRNLAVDQTANGVPAAPATSVNRRRILGVTHRRRRCGPTPSGSRSNPMW